MNSIINTEDTENETPLTQSDTLNIKEKIRITTHNIQGLNNQVKLQQWITYCIEQDLHIISLTETKLKNSKEHLLSNPTYKIYTSNFEPTSTLHRETSLGTAFMIHRNLQPYIHYIGTYPGTAIYIDFYFPNNNKTRIISIYLPSNHQDLLARTQKQIGTWIQEAKQKKWHTIIMGTSMLIEKRRKNSCHFFLISHFQIAQVS